MSHTWQLVTRPPGLPYDGRPLLSVWTDRPDRRPYTALPPAVPLGESNTTADTTPAARRASACLACAVADAAGGAW